MVPAMPLRFTDQRPPLPPVDLIQPITPPRRMLRTGLYELGHHVSVVTEELRAELDEAHPERRDASRA